MSIFRKFKLNTRLKTTFIFVSVIPLILLAVISYNIYSNSIQNKLIQSVRQSAQLASNNVNLILSQHSHYIDLLSVSDAMSDLADISDSMELSERYELTSNVDRAVRNTPIPDISLMGVMILDNKKNSVYGSGHATSINTEVLRLLEASDKSSPKDYIGEYVNPNNRDKYMAIVRKIYSHKLNGVPAGYIIVLISSQTVYESAFASPKISEDSGFMMLTKDGEILVSQDAKGFVLDDSERALINEMMKGSKNAKNLTSVRTAASYLQICYYSKHYDCYLLSVVPYSFISNEQNRVLMILLLVLLPLIAFCLYIASAMAMSITKPIEKMVDASEINIVENEYVPICDTSPDELGFLSRKLDQKTFRIIQLIKDIKESDERKRAAEMEMLHYQINPHFLFNTLGTFKWMSELSSNNVLAEGIESLIGLLRATLVDNSELITLQKEIENLRNYVRIQDLRYISRFSSSYDIDEASLNCHVPHFILQPLVENAILHATAGSERIVNIKVKTKLDDEKLTITVTDDGVGFNTELAYNPAKERFNGVGLQNVNDRLKLYYGTENGLQIVSSPGNGTTCIISIPVNLVS
ncbi:MAG: histidine kinase [Eubacteriales bacterium]|nr:histidine kinase [Eubacteriales bacterium]